MVNGEGTTILHKTGHDRGRIHDYDNTMTPLQVENIFDLGYMGVRNDYPTVQYVYCHYLERKVNVNSQMDKKETQQKAFQTKGNSRAYSKQD